jgi:predicted nuclease of predicted toxin-antitoxin system
MAAIKVYLDEDVHSFIAEALRLRGWQTLTTPQAGNQRTSDIDQIAYATQNSYCILTYNVTDFPRLHSEILVSGGSHAGIIVATQERTSKRQCEGASFATRRIYC